MNAVERSPGVSAARAEPTLRRFELRRLRVPVGADVVPLVVPDAAAWRRQGEWIEGLRRGGEPPYWSRIWLSAVAVARLLQRLSGLAGVAACDLGCGLGLPGVVAARAGARVTFVDRQADALAFARWNAQALGGEDVRCVEVDWGASTLQAQFGLMMLADVSYRAPHHAPLARHLDACLGDDGLVVHADPLREEAAAFLGSIADRYVLRSTLRRTTLRDEAGAVRICLASRTERALADWCARLSGAWEWTPGVVR